MSPSSMQSKPARDAGPRLVNTVLFISNLHCPSCLLSIEDAFSGLPPKPTLLSHSIISHSISVSHASSLSAQDICHALEAAGFEVHSVFQDQEGGFTETDSIPEKRYDSEWEHSLQQAVERWHRGKNSQDIEMGKRQRHVEQCVECQAELQQKSSLDEVPLRNTTPSLSPSAEWKSDYYTDARDRSSHNGSLDTPSAIEEKLVVVEPSSSIKTFQAELSIVGMTCASCVGSITRALEDHPWVRTVNVSLLTNSATVTFEGEHRAKDLVKVIEGAGYDATVEQVDEIQLKSKTLASDTWQVVYAVEGMTCAACVSNITNVLQHHSWIEDVNVNLLANSATIRFKGKDHLDQIKETIEDAGYDATLDNLAKLGEDHEEVTHRAVTVRIDGIYCHHCLPRILDALQRDYGNRVEIEKSATPNDPLLRIKYVPHPLDFTIRNILASIAAVDPAFQASLYHPPTIEDRSRELHARERRRILFRLGLAVIAAIPAFIIGVVFMSLLGKNHPTRQFMMRPMWTGNVSRAEWALFILATPVYFLAADTFHRKAIKELRALWRRGNPTPILRRFYRFGSMNMLMSLGTSIAYFSSIAELSIAATQSPMHASMDEGASSTYFDSVVFLTMFLLIGRFLEAYSKARTGDAVTALGKLRPTEAILIEEVNPTGRNVSVDLLEVGDIVRVPHGSSPPFDGIVLDSPAKFDESSLTGESRLVSKAVGDTVFSGTVNKSGPVSIRVSSVSGTSMLDQIIKIVREGQARRAPVERVADIITGHFVPFVVLVAISTWVVWLSLGLSGALPSDYKNTTQGGWPLWSLRFAIAVFVIACPCGIGLAAPTALFVGGGLAAKHGILVKGGGEAFQEASTLDCIVFDKTGTLTQGGDPAVTDYRSLSSYDEPTILGFTKTLEGSSGHPIAKAIVSFCTSHAAPHSEAKDIEEVPGKGVRGSFRLDGTDQQGQQINMEAIVGSEVFMADNSVDIDRDSQATLNTWKHQGKSVALVALRACDPSSDPKRAPWTLSALFAISDPLRPEAVSTVRALRKRGIDVWMLSGDNPTTARAVGANVGIPAENIIAGVLPDQKAEKIRWLQRSLPKPRRRPRAAVAMVGDGINDSPALTMADVGIAIGSGSDVAISSADFILVSSNLTALLTLIDLSRTVFRRVWFNFGWALVYNLVAMPVAAGVLYPVRSGGGHVRLDPVWASLAMALSSVSVVCSSLLLRSRVPFVGFRTREVRDDAGDRS